MGFFKNLFGGKDKAEEAPAQQAAAPAAETKKTIVYSPLNGEACPLAELNDGVFSEGMLGGGCAIKPSEGIAYAPFDGTVVSIADSKHAVGLQDANDVQVLIHVGLDTVNMNGEGFEVLVQDDEQVKKGQPIIKFDIDKIKAAGYPEITAVLVVDQGGMETLDVLHEGPVTVGEDLIAVE